MRVFADSRALTPGRHISRTERDHAPERSTGRGLGREESHWTAGVKHRLVQEFLRFFKLIASGR
jgi:hypothetical protein